MLGVLAFVGLCIFAALFPNLTAYVIFGAVVVAGVIHFRDRLRK